MMKTVYPLIEQICVDCKQPCSEKIKICPACQKIRKRWHELSGMGKQQLVDLIMTYEANISQRLILLGSKKYENELNIIAKAKDFLSSYIDNNDDVKTMSLAQDLAKSFNE